MRPWKSASAYPDLHATMLHQLGIDHRKLIYVHNGREES